MSKKRRVQLDEEEEYERRKKRDVDSGDGAVNEEERQKILQVMENEPDVRHEIGDFCEPEICLYVNSFFASGDFVVVC